MIAKIVLLIAMVLQLGWMVYCVMGGSPLLILKHDQPADLRLVRGFFDIHYRALLLLAMIGALSAVFTGYWVVAAATSGIAIYAFAAHFLLVGSMDRLRSRMSAGATREIRRFRLLHVTGLLIDIVALGGFLTLLYAASPSLFPCAPVPPGCSGESCRTQCTMF